MGIGHKSGVGTALDTKAVWFALSHGILTEVYSPCGHALPSQPGFLVADGKDFFSEEKRDTDSEVTYLEPGVPAYHLVNTCKHGRYRIEKDVLADPRRPVVLMRVRFVPLKGKRKDYSVFVLFKPHAGDQGADNTAWVGDFKGEPMLFGQRGDRAMAMACTVPWRRRSAGFVGVSDGWQDVSRHKTMQWAYERAEGGNVALTGAVDLDGGDEFVLALGFGCNDGEAGHRALGPV